MARNGLQLLLNVRDVLEIRGIQSTCVQRVIYLQRDRVLAASSQVVSELVSFMIRMLPSGPSVSRSLICATMGMCASHPRFFRELEARGVLRILTNIVATTDPNEEITSLRVLIASALHTISRYFRHHLALLAMQVQRVIRKSAPVAAAALGISPSNSTTFAENQQLVIGDKNFSTDIKFMQSLLLSEEFQKCEYPTHGLPWLPVTNAMELELIPALTSLDLSASESWSTTGPANSLGITTNVLEILQVLSLCPSTHDAIMKSVKIGTNLGAEEIPYLLSMNEIEESTGAHEVHHRLLSIDILRVIVGRYPARGSSHMPVSRRERGFLATSTTESATPMSLRTRSLPESSLSSPLGPREHMAFDETFSALASSTTTTTLGGGPPGYGHAASVGGMTPPVRSYTIKNLPLGSDAAFTPRVIRESRATLAGGGSIGANAGGNMFPGVPAGSLAANHYHPQTPMSLLPGHHGRLAAQTPAYTPGAGMGTPQAHPPRTEGHVDEVLQRMWDLVREHNGIFMLLQTLQIRFPPSHAGNESRNF